MNNIISLPDATKNSADPLRHGHHVLYRLAAGHLQQIFWVMTSMNESCSATSYMVFTRDMLFSELDQFHEVLIKCLWHALVKILERQSATAPIAVTIAQLCSQRAVYFIFYHFLICMCFFWELSCFAKLCKCIWDTYCTRIIASHVLN